MIDNNCEPEVHDQLDTSFDLLAHSHRRWVLYALREDGPARRDELADKIVAAGVADDRNRVVASLVHTHLPKLADCGVIDYDRDEGVVSLARSLGRLEPYLKLTAGRETDDCEWISKNDEWASEDAGWTAEIEQKMS